MNKEQQIEKDRLIQIEEIDELIREKFHGQVAYRMDIKKLKEKFDGYDATSYNGYEEGFHDLQEEIDELLKEYEK